MRANSERYCAGPPRRMLRGWLTVLLLFVGLARASVAGDISVVPDSQSPNSEFGLAVGDFQKDAEEQGEGETGYRALFIVEMKANRLLKELETFRRPSSTPLPSYRATWSDDSTQLGVVARFRRDSELEAYAMSGGKWTRLELPTFDPLQEAQETLKIDGPVTGESEIVSIKWIGNSQLRVDAIAYINTPRQDQLSIEYLFELEEGRWKLSRSH